MKQSIDGKALVYADGAFNTPNGKTAHGLVRFTERYDVVGVIDQQYQGQDAGQVLDGKACGIPIYANLDQAMQGFAEQDKPSTLVIGLAPDGGRLSSEHKQSLVDALRYGMNIDSGLHDFLLNDPELTRLAQQQGCRIRDIRKTPDRSQLHFFTGDITDVACLKVAVLGTDSAVGKRTTAWMIVHELRRLSYKAEMIGTGQTAWMQGAKYSMIMDSCINDFVSGEIEHAVCQAWRTEHPDVIVIEGQGSLLNPAYPGGFEILAAARPDVVVLQHAPTRQEYDGFPGYPLHDIRKQIAAIEMISDKKVIAITVNHENMLPEEIPQYCEQLTKATGLPAFDVLHSGSRELVDVIVACMDTVHENN